MQIPAPILPLFPVARANLTLAEFDILGHAGDGSFSTVIHAVHRTTLRHYAIKVVNKHLVGDSTHRVEDSIP